MERQKIRKFLLMISFLFFPVTLYYFSPYLIIQGGFIGVVTGSLLIFIALFISSLFFGRAFCGWICPAGALQEGCAQIKNTEVKRTKLNLIKYIIWVPWILTILFAFIKAGGPKSIDFFYMTERGISVSGIPGYIMYYFIVGLIMIVSLLVGKRGMCHTICWMAPFMIIGTKIKNRLRNPSLQLQANSAICVDCGQCSRVCPMSLEVSKMVQENKLDNSECILCGECADHCSKKALRLTF